mmetsp:Transcript_2194/g.6526  ORF Transcript_2194/g.6526 Transcript_2194/m.6526 type:complete len:209 (+) Transcript_2194:97-723(+)|eukprot:CAMPEP_0198724624 /NCGR_PEP_ID=MMETSP1475-20131203/2074_1 /TAXON_ID= ORGANISM="Unidentified sp., Strain CCMP1999" /NCGR_SAMPLE_ID=MMETSP1475 /ASSEMBLY_ACC=CAM_ASM_001111 /LENGTH=208 /DNA_ID=CAMNT_0044486203 /DNA_START=86 /DNA_END=712 /DNA_ORIENTATION=+
MAFVGGVGSNTVGRRGGAAVCRRRCNRGVVVCAAAEEKGNGAPKSVDNTRLFEALAKQDINEIEKALNQGASATATDMNGRTALHYVAAIGVTPTSEMLLSMGANVDAKDVMGLTPLHMAAGYARPATVEVLLDRGANANLEDNNGETAYDLVERLVANTPEKKFFMRNKKYDNLSDIRLMLKGATRRGDAASEPASATEEISARTEG